MLRIRIRLYRSGLWLYACLASALLAIVVLALFALKKTDAAQGTGVIGGGAVGVWFALEIGTVVSAFKHGHFIDLAEQLTIHYPFGRTKCYRWDEIARIESGVDNFITTDRTTSVIPLIPVLVFIQEVRTRVVAKSYVSFYDASAGLLLAINPKRGSEVAISRWLVQKQVADFVQRLGGFVQCEPTQIQSKGKPRWEGTAICAVSLRGTPVNDQQFLALCSGLAQCDELAVLELSKTGLTDRSIAGLRPLLKLPELKYSDTRITDAAIAALSAPREQPADDPLSFLSQGQA